MALSVTNLGIDGVENVEQIGTGGSSRVYRARQIDLDRVVAIKVLNPGDDQGVAKRFDRERKAMGRLSLHEGIVPVYSSGITDHGEPYLVMPYYANGSLQDQIDTGAMEWETAVSYVDVAADTIAAAHDEGVVHLDLKPANILLSNTGAPRIADFGIAKLTTGAATAGTTGGAAFTPAYSAPETFLDGDTGPPSDVYGLGATLWALLVGHPPFLTPGEDTNLMAVIGRVVNNPVGDLRHFTPSPICDVIERAMAKKPADRFQTAREFGQALKQAAASSSPNFAPVDGGPAKGTVLFPGVPATPAAGAAAAGGAAAAAGSRDTRMMTHVAPVDLPPSLATTAVPAQAAAPPRPLLQETAQPLPRPFDGGPDEPRGPMLDLDQFRLGPILFGVLAFAVVVGAAFLLLNRGGNETEGDGTVPTSGLASPAVQTTVSGFSSTAATQLDLGSTASGLSSTTESPSTTDGAGTTDAPSTTEAATTTDAPSTTEETTTTSAPSSTTTESTVGTVGAPTGLAAAIAGNDVELTWNAAAGGAPAVGGYRVYRGATPIGTVARTVRTFTDPGLADGTYTYTVRAIGANDAESGPSNSATVTLAPLDVAISASPRDATSVRVTFTSSQRVTYRVSAVSADAAVPRVSPVSTHPDGTPVDNATVTLLGLVPNATYELTVLVWNAADETASRTVTLGPVPAG